MKHPHAELMAQYAQDAMETDKPWERWQCHWGQRTGWDDVEDNPSWCKSTQYRRKPKPYEPTLLDQALELEIEAAKLRLQSIIGNTTLRQAEIWTQALNNLTFARSTAMIEHLKSQGKL